MKSMHRVLATASTILAFSGVVGAPAAQAADTKIQQASTCFIVSGLGAAGAFREAGGRFYNSSLIGEVNISCPILRDNLAVKPISVRVGVRDVSSTLVGPDNISCRLQTANSTGTVGSAGGTVSTTGTNSAGQVLNLPIPVIAAGNTLSVFCTIPRRGAADPNSWIASIFIDEP